MHVVQVVPRYHPNIGGVEVFVQKLSENLVANGIGVTVYSVDLDASLPKQQLINGVRLKRFVPLFADPLYLPDPSFISSLRNEEADVVHAHNIHITTPLLTGLFKKHRQKLILQPHYHRYGQSPIRDSFLRLYRSIFGQCIISRADVVIANSNYEARILQEDFDTHKKLIMIPEGIDTTEIRNLKHQPSMPKTVLYVGTLRKYKNVDQIIKGFALLSAKMPHASRLVVVGTGPEFKSLVELVKRLGVSKSVEWKSGLSRQQVLDEYVKASAFILLSNLESFSRATYDALLIGVPIIVLKHGPMGDLVQTGQAEGISSLNPEEVAGGILRATTGAYRRIRSKPGMFLEWEEYCKRIVGVYRTLTGIDKVNSVEDHTPISFEGN